MLLVQPSFICNLQRSAPRARRYEEAVIVVNGKGRRGCSVKRLPLAAAKWLLSKHFTTGLPPIAAARSFNNIEDGFYISPAFLDKLSIHVAKNFLDLPKIKVRSRAHCLKGRDFWV